MYANLAPRFGSKSPLLLPPLLLLLLLRLRLRLRPLLLLLLLLLLFLPDAARMSRVSLGGHVDWRGQPLGALHDHS